MGEASFQVVRKMTHDIEVVLSERSHHHGSLEYSTPEFWERTGPTVDLLRDLAYKYWIPNSSGRIQKGTVEAATT